MPDILGYPLEEALQVLKGMQGDLVIRTEETSGYRDTRDSAVHSETRVIGVRQTGSEILLITAIF